MVRSAWDWVWEATSAQGNDAAGNVLGLVIGEWINGQQVRNEVPGTASPGTEGWENGGAQLGIMPCWQSSLECWGTEKQRMILARFQHPLEVVCMCEGWITEALAGGGIKSGFSVMLQTSKFHERKICLSQIKTEHVQEKGFNSLKKNYLGANLKCCIWPETNNSECLTLISLKLFLKIHF